jgi:hypothetical protein
VPVAPASGESWRGRSTFPRWGAALRHPCSGAGSIPARQSRVPPPTAAAATGVRSAARGLAVVGPPDMFRRCAHDRHRSTQRCGEPGGTWSLGDGIRPAYRQAGEQRTEQHQQPAWCGRGRASRRDGSRRPAALPSYRRGRGGCAHPPSWSHRPRAAPFAVIWLDWQSMMPTLAPGPHAHPFAQGPVDALSSAVGTP